MKVAIVLSGCGVYDGAEIHESVLTMLSLVKAGAEPEFLAPNIAQAHVINHLSGQVAQGESRNVLVESARIARGKIKDIAAANAADYAAVFFPGGFGAAKNLSDFAFKGVDCQIQPDVLRFAKAIAQAGKPACYICIAPAMIPQVYGPGASVTIGTDADTAAAVSAMGGQHVNCPVKEFVIDKQRKVVSTPAYMLAENIAEAAIGIEAAVNATLALI
ncbi:isoprenoid biosynthesis glyoxalase ElbB [Undibacterium sp. TS12]|uniref:isoprenoid biosynthesis glyoxalase ElbB n=1 Tax=Undibacterium sp. TS12 TaxID=2908202 RepID=UPI001F4C868B|nr:isoprenoid biosynthesis glyoxalase ElbB [Undibacterium sp. TS12]MCH8618862.1 isoprenoid biosynthesis glyoxalase ElbB [Undibacterium sp. TS12]